MIPDNLRPNISSEQQLGDTLPAVNRGNLHEHIPQDLQTTEPIDLSANAQPTDKASANKVDTAAQKALSRATARTEFEKALDFKAFALFAGDSFIKDMRIRNKFGYIEKLEGAQMADALAFIVPSLSYFSSMHGESLTKEQLHTLYKALSCLEKAQPAANEIATISSTKIKILETVAKVFEEVKNTGKAHLLPLGWTDGNGGHAVAFELSLAVDKQSFECHLYNTGDGARYHEVTQSNRLQGDTIRNYCIPVDALDNHFIQLLMEPLVRGGTSVPDSPSEKLNYGPLDVYKFLEKYKVNESNTIENWMKLQMSGTCQTRCFLAFLRAKLGPDLYDRFKRFIKHEGVVGLVEKNKNVLFLDVQMVRTIGFTFQDLYRHFKKEIEAGQATDEKITQWLQRMEQLETSAHLMHTSLMETANPFSIQATNQELDQSTHYLTMLFGDSNEILVDSGELKFDSEPVLPHITQEMAPNDVLVILSSAGTAKERLLSELYTYVHGATFKSTLLSKEQCATILAYIKKSSKSFNPSCSPQAFTLLLLAREVVYRVIEKINEMQVVYLAIDQSRPLNEAAYITAGLMAQRYKLSVAQHNKRATNDEATLRRYERFDSETKERILALPYLESEYIVKWLEKKPSIKPFFEKNFDAAAGNVRKTLSKNNWIATSALTLRSLPDYFYTYLDLSMKIAAFQPSFELPPNLSVDTSDTLSQCIIFSNDERSAMAGFYLNANNNWEWLEESIVRPEQFAQQSQSVMVFPILPPSLQQEELKIKAKKIEETSREAISSPIRQLVPLTLKPHFYFEKFEPETANLLAHLKSESPEKSPFPLASFALFLDRLESVGERWYEKELQGLVVENRLNSTLKLCEAIEKEPLKTAALFDIFFKRRAQFIEATLMHHPLDVTAIECYLYLTEWQIQVSNLLTAMGHPELCFKEAISERIEQLKQQNLIVSDPRLGNYLLQLEILSLEFISKEPSHLLSLLNLSIKWSAVRDSQQIISAASPYLAHVVNAVIQKYAPDFHEFFSNSRDYRPLMQLWIRSIAPKADPDSPFHMDATTGQVQFNSGETLYTYLIAENKLLVGQATPVVLPITETIKKAIAGRTLSHTLQLNSELYTAQVGEDKLIFKGKPNVLPFPVLIQKTIDANAFGYSDPMFCQFSDQLVSDPNLAPLIAWTFQSGREKGVAYFDPFTGKLKGIQNANKEFLLIDYPGKKFSARNSAFTQLNAAAFILLEKTRVANPQALLFLPHMTQDDFPLTFRLNNGRWESREGKLRFLSMDQNRDLLWKNGIVVENEKGVRSLLIPERPIHHKNHELKTRVLGNAPENIALREFTLYKGSPKTSSFNDSLFLAYEALLQASLPQEYEKALELLRDTLLFKPLQPADYKWLGWIIYSARENRDTSVHAAAVRLYALWMIKNNRIKYGPIGEAAEKPPLLYAPAERFQSFLNLESNTNAIENELINEYQLKRRGLTPSLLLENSLSKGELLVFKNNPVSEEQIRETVRIPLPDLIDTRLRPEQSKVMSLAEIRQLLEASVPYRPINEMRLNPQRLIVAFKDLYQKAGSPNEKDRTIVKDLLNLTINDPNPTNYMLRVVLALRLGNKRIELEKYLYLMNASDQAGFENALKKDFSTAEAAFPVPGPIKTSAPSAELSLIRPDQPQKTDPISFMERTRVSGPGTLSRFNTFYNTHYKRQKARVQKIEPLNFTSKDPFVQKELDALDADYFIGAQKNGAHPIHAFTGNLAELREEIDYQLAYLEEEAFLLKEKIITLANSRPLSKIEEIQQKASRKLGEDNPLSVDELRILFLRGDRGIYKEATGLDDASILALDHLIGEYLLVKRRAGHASQILNDLRAGQTERAGEKMQMAQRYTPSEQTRAFMVFEEALELYLRPDQIESLEKILPYQFKGNVLLQKIQGGGKSLVFGHLLALLKADGFHLSVHVAPTPQYPTAIQDMYRVSHRLFKQKERVLEYHDSDPHNKVEYLHYFHNTMKEAISNREYITVTKETLLALRDKYIKLLDRASRQPAWGSSPIPELEVINDILSLLKEKAIFTFDEAHLAFDPAKELNMPVGKTTKINPGQARLIKEIVLSALDGPKESIGERFVSHDAVKKLLGITDPVALAEVHTYIQGEEVEIPPFLSSGQASLAAIARQMIAKGLLGDLLQKRINEEHGLPLDPEALQISVPYVANMKPAENSEFSDTLSMMVYTHLVYAQEGLRAHHIKGFISYLREKLPVASNEVNTLLGADLRSIDCNNQDVVNDLVARIRKSLPAWRPFILDFVNEKIFDKVELFDEQITSNGQNAASLCKSFVAYTASLENPNMAPVGTRIEADVGTNGQTIDLYLKKGTFKTIETGFKAAIREAVRYPEVKAIIDAGCFFRGMTNLETAKELTNAVKEPIKGVLFFGTNGRLNLLRKGEEKPCELSGTSKEVIAAETGLTTNELFTYYDQDHITGVDIAQDPSAKALLTCGSTTELHELLQGGRRMRELDKGQRLTILIDKATETLLDGTLSIKKIIEHSALNEINLKRQHNLLFLLQKLENSLQDKFLEIFYSTPTQRERTSLFQKVRPLFVKSIAADYVREFAGKKTEQAMKEFLEVFVLALLGKTNDLLFDDEIKAWREACASLINKTLEELPQTIEVTEGSLGPLPNARQDSIQIREQEKQTEKERTEERMVILDRKVMEFTVYEYGGSSLGNLDPFSPEEYQDASNPSNFCQKSWSLSDVINHERKGRYVDLFSKNALVRSSIVKLFQNRPNFLDSPVKTNFYLVIGLDNYNPTVTAIPDVESKMFLDSFLDCKFNKKIVRANGEVLYDDFYPKNESYKYLLVELMFARGDLKPLDNPDLLEVFNDWALKSRYMKDKVKAFFDNEIKGKHKGIEGTEVYQALDSL